MTTVTRNIRFKVRGRTAAEWTTGNEVLLAREIGLETDTRKHKYGDGTTAWNSLPYAKASLAADDIEAALGVTSAADKVLYATGAGTWALSNFTAFGRSLVDDANASAARATLGLVIGTNVQAWDADLDAVAGLSSGGLVVRTGAGTAAARSVAGTANEITVANGDGASGNPTLSLPASLTFTSKTVTGGTFSSVAISGSSTASLSSLITLVNTNKRFRSREVTSSALSDFSSGGAALTFSRPNDGADDLVGIYTYITSGNVGNFVTAARNDVILAAGGASAYNSAPERLRVVGSTGHILPGADNTQNLGSGSLRFATLNAGAVVTSSLRIDQTPSISSATATHKLAVNLNGTPYYLLLSNV